MTTYPEIVLQYGNCMSKSLPSQLRQSFFDTTPLGVYQTTPDGRIIAANEVFINMLGIHSKDISTINLDTYKTGAMYPREKFKKIVAEKSEVIGLEYAWKKKNGKTIYVRENARAVRDGDVITHYEGTVEDITDRKIAELELRESKTKLEEVHRKLSFLAETARRMSTTMDFTKRLKTFAKMVVPEIADWCAIDILTDTDMLETVAVGHVDSDKLQIVKEYKNKHHPDPNRSDGIWNVIRSGKALFLPSISNKELTTLMKSKSQAAMIKEIGVHSIIVLPLTVRGKTFGAITLANTNKRGQFTRSDFSFAQVFTTRAALLVDNARLFIEAKRELAQREHMEKLLRERARKHLAVFNGTLDPIIIVEDDGRIVESNKAAKKLFGIQKGQDSTFFQFFATDQKKRLHLKWKTLLRSGKVYGQAQLETTGGQKYEVEYSAASNIMPYRHVVVIRDITSQKEEERRRDHFLGIASHEMKNALAGIKSFTQLLQRKLDNKDEKPQEYVRRIDMNTNRLNRLMEDLMDMTRLKSQQLTLIKDSFEINSLIKDVAEEMQVSYKRSILVHTENPVFVSADRVRIRQVLTNLMKNAVKYSPDDKEIIVASLCEAGNIRVSVQDFGIGISKEDQKKIFDLFYRVEDGGTHTAGLGIGLYISYEIIKMHGGKFFVTSTKKKGSTFSFLLPIY